MDAMPTLHTARLVLRPFQERDLEAVLSFHSRPDVARYVPWPPRDRQQVREAIAGYMASTRLKADGDFLNFAVDPVAASGPIGQVLIRIASAEHRCGEVGYVFHPGVYGRGYATEATEEVLRWTFQEARLHRVLARIDARNDPSARVLERLGMRREAHFVRNEFLKGEWTDEVIYAILADEYATTRGVDLPSAQEPRSYSSA